MKERILKSIFQKMPTQEKRLWKTWEEFPEASEELDEFLQKAAPVLDRYAIDAEQIAQAYLTMAAQTMEARLEFMRTGRYPAQWKQVVAELYAEPSPCCPMSGLWLSRSLFGGSIFCCGHFIKSLCRKLKRRSVCWKLAAVMVCMRFWR